MEKKIFWLAPIIAMGIGFLPMPYGYYTLSRFIVCGCSLYYAYNLYQQKDMTFVWILLLQFYITLLFQCIYMKKKYGW